MRLENQFFHFFFYPFLIGVIISGITIIVCSSIFTDNYIDKITGINLVDIGKEYSKSNINSAIDLVSSTLYKVQISLNELVITYVKIANLLKKNSTDINRNINDNYLKCVLDLNESFNENNIKTSFMAYWLLDLETNLYSLKSNSNEENQLITFSNMMRNIFSIFYSTNSTLKIIYSYFESTDLYISFPLIYEYQNGFINEIINYTDNPFWCTDEKGEIYKIYKTRCRGFYANIKKAKTDIFDINHKDNENRTIFLTEFYVQASVVYEIIFSMCLEFIDPISGLLAYFCSDVESSDLNFNLDIINSKINGYFFMNSVGFFYSFYFPENPEETLTLSENIYRWDKKFFLQEKMNFLINIEKLMTSNYIKYINDSLYEEVFVNGENSNNQFFYINGEKYNFSIYPIVLENFNGIKEHVLNIIYVYNDKIFIDEIKFLTNFKIKIILELILIIIFGSGLLYIIVLSFNTLARYIVISIKNQNYMLKGINIGGKNRMKYLNYLKKRQDENCEFLEIMNSKEYIQNLEDNNNDGEIGDLKEDNNDIKEFIDKEKNDNKFIKDSPSLYKNKENINIYDKFNGNELFNSKINYYNKIKEESEYIERESNFYDFDEKYLQCRPLEIDRLIKILIDLKRSLLLTSTQQPVDQIIDYANSENIFDNLRNKNGKAICQSNIGNLQIQILQFDKAIYHLVTSLQDNKLNKFLAHTLNDQFDEKDSLLNMIANYFHNNKEKTEKNKLAEKQLNNSKNNFSQKIIGILINSRYKKLIYSYNRFFSLFLKLGVKSINGLYINTNYHNIMYYHRIIIQYIYLCFVKNDLVKIGESILDYLEFLIKFKFRLSISNKSTFDITKINMKKLDKKLQQKKFIFNKIINWFNLFDEYISYIRNNTSISDDNNLIQDLSINSSEINAFNLRNQSPILFKINLQRAEFLKGKFALKCKNYTDALFFFIRAAKKKSIVLDALIKKKSLKKISKIISYLIDKYNDYEITNGIIEDKIQEFERLKLHLLQKNYINYNNIKYYGTFHNTFKKELMIIKNDIAHDIEKYNIKATKDIIFILDINIYNQGEEYNYKRKLDIFIDQIKTIFDNYLYNNDRLAIFIYKNQFQIICPLTTLDKIRIDDLSKDLINYKNNYFNKFKEDIDFLSSELKENNSEKLNIELQYDKQNLSESDYQEFFGSENETINNEYIIKGLVQSLNFSQKYLKIKEVTKNEKYIILFTNIFNNYNITDEIIQTNFSELKRDKDIIFLLVGKDRGNFIKDHIYKNKQFDLEEESQIIRILREKFGERSELIDFENTKKIKNILSTNVVIEDEIVYQNEIYK